MSLSKGAASDREERRPARYVCPQCGVGDHLYTRAGQPCAYCVPGRVVDRFRYVMRQIFGLRGRDV